MQFLANYSLFLLKALTIVVAVLLIVSGIVTLLRKAKGQEKGALTIKKLNKKYQEFTDILQEEILTKADFKKLGKEKKATAKAEAKAKKDSSAKRVFVLQFEGDIKASPVSSMREEISAILCVATPNDEVVLCLESGGGLVTSYGLAASQLRRLKEKKIPLTIIVDKIAASGGYMMACVADRILAAPFAVIGSIGVIAQFPNFHRFLKKKDIDFEQLTAGQFKRTLTLFGENTEKAREKMQEEIEEIHTLFKDFIIENRPQVDLAQVATGEHWLGTKALSLKLIDGLSTSDDYLLNVSDQAKIYQLNYIEKKKSLVEKIGSAFSSLLYNFQNNSSRI